jgi:hypothetical protein
VVDGGLLSRRPLQKVVELGLQLAVLGIAPGRAVVERLAEQADPVVGQAAA